MQNPPKRILIRIAPLFIAMAVIHCSSVSTQVINGKALQTAESAENFAKSGKMAEAEALIYDLQYLHPDDPAVRKLQNKLTIEYRTLMESKKILGKNVLHKKRRQRTVGERIIYYIPDLVGDFLDIFTAEVSVGPQIGIDLHMTRAVNATAYTGATVAAGAYQKQGLGWRREGSLEINAGPVGPNAVRGTVESILHSDRPDTGAENFALHRPAGNLYQTYRDYWSGGYKLGLILVGANVEIHFLEIADFLTGIVGYDLLDDNIGATENFDLTPVQAQVKNDLESYISSGQLGSYHDDFPRLGYLSAEERAEKASGLIRISAAKNSDEPAHIVILNFSNNTGSPDYVWLSGALSSAIFDSMKKGFVFKGGNPDANQVLAGNVTTGSQTDTGIYAQVCEKIDADYLILGTYNKVGKNQIEVVAQVYSRSQKKVLSEFRKKADASSAIFSVSDEISKDVVQLMKNLPRT